MVARKITDDQIIAEHAKASAEFRSAFDVATQYDITERTLRYRVKQLGLQWPVRPMQSRASAVTAAQVYAHDAEDDVIAELEKALADAERREWTVKAQAAALEQSLARAEQAENTRQKRKVGGEIWAIMTDSHGMYADEGAINAFFNDMREVRPSKIIMIGDHVDCAGFISAHPNKALEEMGYSYREDIEAANSHLDQLQAICPKAEITYIEGNHEWRWFANSPRIFGGDAAYVTDTMQPARMLRLEERGIRFIRFRGFYDNLPFRGAVRMGECIFMHGFKHNLHATYTHAQKVGANVVHGHTHRRQEHVIRTGAGIVMGRSYGCLCDLSPAYVRQDITDWVHGYGMHFVEPDTGWFSPVPVLIDQGRSTLPTIMRLLNI